MYDVKNQAYVEFIFDNEHVELTFDPKDPNETLQFTASENNKIYQDYLKASQHVQQELDSLQVAYFNAKDEAAIENTYGKKIIELNMAQNYYEKLADNKLTSHFIKASRQFYEATPISTPENYLISVQSHFFDNVDFNHKVLQNSTFIHDKINQFIFHLNSSDDPVQLCKAQKRINYNGLK